MKRPPNVQHILQLISSLIVPMYYIHRDIVPPKRSPLRENDAEHSWALALLACALAPQINPKLDIGKVAQFAIVHDVVEVYSGDVSAMDSQAANSSERKIREAAALERIQSDFSYMPWIAETIKEYESFSSEEACFVYALDKFMPVAYDSLIYIAFFTVCLCCFYDISNRLLDSLRNYVIFLIICILYLSSPPGFVDEIGRAHV